MNMHESFIFHLCRATVWREQIAVRLQYVPADFAREGFIHCSGRDQLLNTAKRYYSTEKELLVLCIPVSKYQHVLKWELAKNGQKFPHLYAPIVRTHIEFALSMNRDEMGEFTMPSEILKLNPAEEI